MPSGWITEWNDIIRNVLFKDAELKRLMKIPDKTTIIDFIDYYFIRAGYTGKLLTDQSVRIVYGVVHSSDSGSPYVSCDEICFDIYVKDEEAHNAFNDRLIFRNQAIAERIIYLLSDQRNTKGYKFHSPQETDLGTSMIGYTRYHVSMRYMRTH